MKSIIILGITMLLTVTSAVAQIACSAAFTTDGITLSQIQTKTQEMQKQNEILSEKVYTEGSLYHIASQAATLGFSSDKSSQIVLAAPAPLAYR